MRRARPTPPRIARAAALGAATAALALALRASTPLAATLGALALAALLTPALEWPSPPAPLARVLPRITGLALVAAALLGWSSRSLGILLLEPTLLPSVAGTPVVLAALVYALAPRAFAPGSTLVPATIAVLVLAGLDPAPAGFGGSLLPFLRTAEHNGFAEVYLGLALVVLAASWTAGLLQDGPRWRQRDVVAVGVAGVLAAGLAAAGVAGLPLLQPRVERAFAEAFASGTTGLSGESTLGEYAELAVSRRRVLDLEASVEGGQWLLRSEVFTAFDGRRWTSPAAGRRRTLLRPAPAPPDAGPLLADTGAWFVPGPSAGPGRPVEVRVVQAEVGRWPLLLPRNAAAVTADVPYLERDRFGAVRRPGGIPIALYGAQLATGPARPDAEPLPDDERRESLALPESTHPGLRALALALAPPDAAPRDRLRRTVAHLQSGFTYTLKPGPFRTADPVAEFLLEKRSGYCEYFASAAVVLLRLQGVPARFVKGLSVGPQTDQGGGLHVVRESDAHAWVEAWLPGEGWVEADPTPPAQFAGAHAPAGGLERLVQRARATVAAAWARVGTRGPMSLLRRLGPALGRLAGRVAREPLAWAALVAVLLAPRLVRAWRSRRAAEARREERAETVPDDLRQLVREVERRWRAAGRSRPAARGLLEHARLLALPAPAPPGLPAALARSGLAVVELYYAVRYGGQAPSEGEIDRLRDALRA